MPGGTRPLHRDRVQAPAGQVVPARRLVGILPQARQKAPGRPAAQGHAAVVKQQIDGAALLPPGLFRGLDGQFPRPSLLKGRTQMGRRTPFAQGGAVGQAHRGSQLHQGLIVVPGGVHGDHPGQGLGHPLLHGRGGDVPPVPGDAGDDPQHVAVHRRGGQAEGDGAHRPRRVVPHAGQGADVLIALRKAATEAGHDRPGGPLQIPGPAVVAQPLPQFHQPLLGHLRQGLHIGQLLQEAAVVVQHRRHPGLLQHDLRHPDAVGRGLFPPGQVPGVLPVPQQQRQGQIIEFHRSSELPPESPPPPAPDRCSVRPWGRPLPSPWPAAGRTP